MALMDLRFAATLLGKGFSREEVLQILNHKEQTPPQEEPPEPPKQETPPEPPKQEELPPLEEPPQEEPPEPIQTENPYTRAEGKADFYNSWMKELNSLF